MIIAHNNDFEAFRLLLTKSIEELRGEADQNQSYYLKRGGINLEKDIFSIFQKNAAGTIFEGGIELISGQKFPDIVAYVNDSKAFGLEVKTTNKQKWRSTGSSIFEGTRVPNVENIYLLFGKLVDPIEFKCRKYEDCLYDVAITHSPRYLIDMEIASEATIFSKVGIEYDELRKLSNPFSPIKRYLRKNLKPGSDLWWVDHDEDQARNLEVQSWASLDKAERNRLKATGLALFPNLFGPSPTKYHRFATYLVSQHGIVCHSLRDTFSAGGQVKIKGVMCPRLFGHVRDYLAQIKHVLHECDPDDLAYYWSKEAGDLLPIEKNRFVQWKDLCQLNADKNKKLSGAQLTVLAQLLTN